MLWGLGLARLLPQDIKFSSVKYRCLHPIQPGKGTKSYHFLSPSPNNCIVIDSDLMKKVNKIMVFRKNHRHFTTDQKTADYYNAMDEKLHQYVHASKLLCILRAQLLCRITLIFLILRPLIFHKTRKSSYFPRCRMLSLKNLRLEVAIVTQVIFLQFCKYGSGQASNKFK